jgi:ATP-binding cassette subfamily B protein
MIIIMENGIVDAVGTHEELLKTSTIYQEVYYSQQKGGEE